MDTVTTLATIPAILALVQLSKSFGISGKWATLLAVVLGVVLQVVEYTVSADPTTTQGWYQAAATGLILGLSAAGLYDTAKRSADQVTYTTLQEAQPVDAGQLVGVDPDAPEWWNPELPNYGEPSALVDGETLDASPKHAAE
ncbi:hypothetical protein U6G28_02675 [Actinomycetaceae bacterium MB13-C1-2]|nr:hypothetical protein U6G28_02675 [Actinomycetaceae bacterium MB13-C1-2]